MSKKMSNFQPGLGQPLECPKNVEHALESMQLAWDATRQEDNPFSNTGNRYDGKAFKAHAYSWSDDDQEFNFTWRDVRVSWYKYLGRGTTINREMTDVEIAEMLRECMGEILNKEAVVPVGVAVDISPTSGLNMHSKEPWRLGRNGTVVADEPVPEIGGSDAIEYFGGHLIGESIAARNARRIVACVNACAGFSTEELEAGVLNLFNHKEIAPQLKLLYPALESEKRQVAAFLQQIQQLDEKNDELVAAARAVVERWETPKWKDAPATAGYIYCLRDLLPKE